MEASCDNNIRSIGVHGMGGIGKTTSMISLINRKLQGTQLFNQVIVVTVLENPEIYKNVENPDIKNIQKQIADRLGIELDHESQINMTANQLVNALKGQKIVLIILVDVWKKLGIHELGIPSDNKSTSSKIIIATRIRTACQQMGVKKIMAMNGLSPLDLLTLFNSTIGDVALNPDLKPLA